LGEKPFDRESFAVLLFGWAVALLVTIC